MPSEDVLGSVRPVIRQCMLGLSEADVAPSGVLQGFGGTTEIQKEIIARGLGL
jgi:hypothetical protein